MTIPFSRLIGGIFLIAGSCIGGGMLALPVETGVAGFVPSFAIITLCYFFMMMTGLLLIEANLWMEEGAHLFTMASRLLGPFGKFLSIVIYLFMGYGSLVAYNSGGSLLIMDALQAIAGITVERWEACLIFGIIFGLIFAFGTNWVGRINSVLVFALIGAYILMVFFGSREIRPELLKHRDWAPMPLVLPLLLATFSFQMMVPSLTPYLKRDPKALRLAIVWGLTLPYVIYVLWQLIVLGTVPLEGSHGLLEAMEKGYVATQSLRYYAHFPALSIIAQFFAFFALVTSFFGIGLGLYDFLADLTKYPKKGVGKYVLMVAVLLPTLFITLLFPEAFLMALDLSGGFGDAILSGMMPVAMVWIGRYRLKEEGPFHLIGGRPLLVLLGAFYFTVFVIQIVKL